MSTKRLYFETEKTIVTKTKGWIDVEMDYIQVYKNVFYHTKNLKSKYGLQYLMWIMGKANDDNMIPHNEDLLIEFCNEFEDAPSLGTVRNAISELVKKKIFIKYTNSSYQLNPLIFWSDDTKKRLNHIVESNKFIELNEGLKQF